MRRKLTIEDMQELARKRGGECLSKNYVRANTKLEWRCENGHVWQAIPANIIKGRWCPVCARSFRSTLKRQQEKERAKGNLPEIVAKRIQALREETGLTYEKLSKLIGFSAGFLSTAGRARPGVKRLGIGR